MTQIQPSPHTGPAAEQPTSEQPLVPTVPGRPAPALKRRRPSYRRWPIALAAVVIVAGGVTLGFVLTGSSSAAYTSYTLTTGSVSQTVTASGTLQPVTSSDVNFQVSGTVNSVAISQGQTVTAGQTLATLDTTSLQLSLQEAQASLSSAESTLSSDEDSGASSSTIESDEAQVSSAQSSLTQAQDNLNDATLKAPIAGTVMTLNLAVGDNVSGSSSSSSSDSTGSDATGSDATGSDATGSDATGSDATGSDATGSSSGSSSSTSGSSSDVVIEDLSQFEVSASVSASSASSVKVGDQAVVTPSSSSSTSEIYGTVSSVASVPTVSSGVATFPVVVGITGSPSGLYSGTSANVSIITEQRTGVLVVPSSAITESGSGAVVERLVDGKEVPTRVTTGLEGGSDTQITAGLRRGDKVAVPVVSSGSAATGAGSDESPFGGLSRGGITGGSGFGGLGGGFTGEGRSGIRSFGAP